jgi:NAD dependent epimerase/dehydratase family enzyme
MKGENYRIKVYIIRLGLVLCKNGDALEKMLPPFKFGLGSNNE